MFTRRHALKTVAAAGAASMIEHPWPVRAEAPMGLNEAFAQLWFNPTAPGNTFIVIITDIHVDPISRIYNTPTIDDRLVNAIKSMNPAPSRIVFLGDLAISCTEAFGMTLSPEARAWTLDELRRGKQELARFAPIPVSMMLGNHDTYNYDTDGSIWRQVFITEPTYQVIEIGGMKWFLLNGNHSGDIDANQEAWLAQQVATLDPAEEIAIGVHQPSLSSVGNERGIGRTLGRVFAGYTGKIWVFSGHAHRFSFSRFSLPQTVLNLVGVTTANAEAFNDGKNPGFMVVGISNGHLAAMVRRDCKEPGYEIVDHQSPNALPVPLPKTWSSVQFPIRLFEEGSYNRSGILAEAVANDTGTWWAYVRMLTFRLPMNPRADQFLLLAVVVDPLPTIEFSTDNGATWIQSWGVVASVPDQLYTVPLPQSVRKHAAPLVRIRVNLATECAVSGFGLAASPASVSAQERWRFEHFATLFDEGDANFSANPSGDGLSNLAKFAYGLDPNRHDRRLLNPQAPRLGGEPILKIQKNSRGIMGLHATYLRRRAITVPGIQYQLQTSFDLANWRTISGNAEKVTSITDDWELVDTMILHSSPGKKQFWRMHLVLQ